MKRLLKKTFKKQFGAVAPQQHAASTTNWCQRQVRQKIAVMTSVLTAATLSLVTGRPAEALSVFPVDLSNYPEFVLNTDLIVSDTFGNDVNVNFSWTGNTDNFEQLRPSDRLTGGFSVGSILEIQHDPALFAESVTLNINFGAEIEQARLIVIDVDRDNANTWQDQVNIGGSVAPNTITPATVASPPLEVSPEAAAGVTGVALGIDQPNGAVTFPGLAAASDFTVDITGTEFIGVYNPRSLDPRLNGAVSTTEFTPQDATPTGGVAVNPTAPLPNPQDPNPPVVGAPPENGVEAQNQSPEGTVTADYSAANGPLTNLTFTYSSGPAAVPDGLNPAGPAGYITNANDANGGPGNHGVGLYTIFLVPGNIGTAKSAGTPVQVSATEFDVTYTVSVQNFGARTPLTNIQITDNLVDTFEGTTGFTVVALPTFISGPESITGPPNAQRVNNLFNGNGDVNLLDGTGSLNPGERAVIQYTVRLDSTAANITPGRPEPYNNIVVGEADTPIGLRITDTSQDNSIPPDPNPSPNPDPNNDGDPREFLPTPVVLPNLTLLPRINVSEQVVGTPVLNPTTGPAPTFPNNTARVLYRIRVQNTGNERLEQVQLINDFTDTFDNSDRGGSGLDTGFEIISVIRSGGNETTPIPANVDYNGGDTFIGGVRNPAQANEILATNGVLNPGEFAEYDILVDVDTSGNGETLIRELPGPFDNFTTATGVGTDPNTPSGITVRDISNDATGFNSLEEALNPPGGSATGGSTLDPAPAPTPSADPANENVPTPVSLALTPEISVIEQIDDSRTQVGEIPPAGGLPASTFGGSNVRLVYQVVVRNIGIEDLQNVQLTNSFVDTYGVSGEGPTDDFFIVGVGQPAQGSGVTTVPVNPNFDGSGDLLLAGDPNNPGSTLNVDEFAVYEIVVDVNTAGTNVVPRLPGPFDNQTTTTGIGITSGETTSDFSNDINPFPNGGTTPDPTTSDPNGNLEANEPGENTPTPALLGADLTVVKRITRVIRGGVDLPVAGIDNFNNEPATNDDDTLANLSGNSLPLGVFIGPDQLQSGDLIEYTIYFFNSGVATATNVEICDELQVPSVLQPNSLTLASPTALSQLGTNLTFAADGSLLFPQAPLATLAESCLSFPGSFPAGTPTGGLGVGAGGGVIAGGANLGLNVNTGEVGAVRFTVAIP
ncbi:hypothetical protein [Leptothoe spongobia]|uniref:DUF11 domain-containing protein n=1 Tax=Leptothoe spongobia TAU-MAC 1115 TaxID=1967444 RepID=A0A947DDZ9_9CYAN|nr:hypothetical protein [Leptothoe spongobia]MBT9314624.1 hypothetical protein [Leptothoe spongobia TAU-MAC 1115]